LIGTESLLSDLNWGQPCWTEDQLRPVLRDIALTVLVLREERVFRPKFHRGLFVVHRGSTDNILHARLYHLGLGHVPMDGLRAGEMLTVEEIEKHDLHMLAEIMHFVLTNVSTGDFGKQVSEQAGEFFGRIHRRTITSVEQMLRDPYMNVDTFGVV